MIDTDSIDNDIDTKGGVTSIHKAKEGRLCQGRVTYRTRARFSKVPKIFLNVS